MVASAYHVISKEGENHILRYIFRQACMFKPLTLTMGWNYEFLCKYYIVISDTQIGSWVCLFCCSL